MAEIRSGFRHLLAKPGIYDNFQRVVGAYAWRGRVVSTVINPMLAPGARVIDIGCGTADALSHLRQDVDYFGFDRNSGYIASAQRRFSARSATFACRSVGEDQHEPEAAYDLALAFGLMHHLDDSEVATLLQTVKRVLRPEGALVLIDPVFTKEQSWLARYIVGKDRGQNIRTLDGYVRLCEQVFPLVRAVLDPDPLRIPYTGVVITCSPQQGHGAQTEFAKV